MKLLVLLALALVAIILWKKMNAPTVRRAESGTASDTGPAAEHAVARRALDEAQQAMYARLQTALPSTMVLARPALGQIIDTGGDAARFAEVALDFAVCRKDSSPIGVIVLDDRVSDAVEQTVLAAGLRFARFRSARLPGEEEIKEAMGFL